MKKEAVDTVVYIDSHYYPEGQYQPGNELYLCGANGARDLIVHDVSVDEYLELYRDPSEDALRELLSRHLRHRSQSGRRNSQNGMAGR